MNGNDSNKVAMLVLGFLALAFVESVLLGNGNIIFLLLGGVFFYYGYKQREKWTVIIASIFIFLALMSLWSLRLLFLAAIVYVLVKMWKGTPSNEIFGTLRTERAQGSEGLWRNRLFSVQSTPFSAYEWEDVHMQGLFGNIHVDVTDTVLPKGASFISIRQSVGKIIIDLPYDIPVRFHYATLYGEADVLGRGPRRLLNESMQETDGYETKQPNDPELIISLFTWIGDVEVRRK
ncbi:cell wall-active antibiotics response protein LiaF [Sporosarcina cascadiensis]|uniref:cell wall-active antibiotics response protein LiaF n=1 Tax=Sporosarcina cascadiensis TaxID=2660747 RepID=UPI00129A2FCC|nr:cell wall-active antibiotics response protein LiaF [Sporosarcina cascadiensis]